MGDTSELSTTGYAPRNFDAVQANQLSASM